MVSPPGGEICNNRTFDLEILLGNIGKYMYDKKDKGQIDRPSEGAIGLGN